MLEEKIVYIEGCRLVRYEDENGNLYFDEFGERLDKELTEYFKGE